MRWNQAQFDREEQEASRSLSQDSEEVLLEEEADEFDSEDRESDTRISELGNNCDGFFEMKAYVDFAVAQFS